MRVTVLGVLLECLLAVGVCGAIARAMPPDRTLTMDVTELVAGREVAGKPEFAIVHEGIEYQFASAESKAAFEKDPAKFEVADGGACGRMGPLAGIGDARRRVVHGGRVYFFASNQCRAAFEKEPAKFIEVEDSRPVWDGKAGSAGKAILGRMMVWAGGEERIKALKSYRETAVKKEAGNGQEMEVGNEFDMSFPSRFAQKQWWNEAWFWTIRAEGGGAFRSPTTHEDMAKSRVRAFDRQMARHPLVILRAAATPGDDLVAIAAGGGKVGEAEVEFVNVWLCGASTKLAIEKGTGRLVQESFVGRDGTMSVGESVRTFTQYKTVAGVQLPSAYTVVFNGKDLPSGSVTLTTVEVDPVLPESTFSIKE